MGTHQGRRFLSTRDEIQGEDKGDEDVIVKTDARSAREVRVRRGRGRVGSVRTRSA